MCSSRVRAVPLCEQRFCFAKLVSETCIFLLYFRAALQKETKGRASPANKSSCFIGGFSSMQNAAGRRRGPQGDAGYCTLRQVPGESEQNSCWWGRAAVPDLGFLQAGLARVKSFRPLSCKTWDLCSPAMGVFSRLISGLLTSALTCHLCLLGEGTVVLVFCAFARYLCLYTAGFELALLFPALRDCSSQCSEQK